jgi:aerobic carbon-monoxide dehydrogenase medium subunit
MKACSFEFIRARSVGEASRLLGEADGNGRVIAGGQSLGPMMNLRLALPRLLVDITGIPEMTVIEEASDSVTLGACVTSADIEDRKLRGACPNWTLRLGPGIIDPDARGYCHARHLTL